MQFPKLTAEEERPVDGFGTTGQPQHKLLTWPYTNKNTLYYDSSQQKSVALTNAEKAMQVQVSEDAEIFVQCLTQVSGCNR